MVTAGEVIPDPVQAVEDRVDEMLSSTLAGPTIGLSGAAWEDRLADVDSLALEVRSRLNDLSPTGRLTVARLLASLSADPSASPLLGLPGASLDMTESCTAAALLAAGGFVAGSCMLAAGWSLAGTPPERRPRLPVRSR